MKVCRFRLKFVDKKWKFVDFKLKFVDLNKSLVAKTTCYWFKFDKK